MSANNIVDTTIRNDLRRNDVLTLAQLNDAAIRAAVDRLKANNDVTEAQLNARLGHDIKDFWGDTTRPIPLELAQYFKSLMDVSSLSVVNDNTTTTGAFAAASVVSMTTAMASLFRQFDDGEKSGMQWIVAMIFGWLTFIVLIMGVVTAAMEFNAKGGEKKKLANWRAACAVLFSSLLIILEGLVAGLEAGREN